MNKSEFLLVLRDRLSGLPEEDIKRSVEYYSEMIDDRIDDGLSEEEAVEAIGSIDEIVSQILTGISLPKLVKAKVKPKHTLRGWEILLLILGFPLWMSLLAAAASVILAFYIVLWSIIIVLYSVAVSFAACAIAGILSSLAFIFVGGIPSGVLTFGVGLIFLGITILFFFIFKLIAKGIFIISKKILLGIKACFFRKGDSK